MCRESYCTGAAEKGIQWLSNKTGYPQDKRSGAKRDGGKWERGQKAKEGSSVNCDKRDGILQCHHNPRGLAWSALPGGAHIRWFLGNASAPKAMLGIRTRSGAGVC